MISIHSIYNKILNPLLLVHKALKQDITKPHVIIADLDTILKFPKCPLIKGVIIEKV